MRRYREVRTTNVRVMRRAVFNILGLIETNMLIMIRAKNCDHLLWLLQDIQVLVIVLAFFHVYLRYKDETGVLGHRQNL